jgi:hypothetical protein
MTPLWGPKKDLPTFGAGRKSQKSPKIPTLVEGNKQMGTLV